MTTKRAFLGATGAALMVIGLTACGGDTVTGPPPPTPPPTPAVAITGIGAGSLTLHPSADSRFALALETPIKLTETAGGTADWNFARISFFLAGKEVERFELGADVIRNYGYNRISANYNQTVKVYFRTNSDDFDRVDITLGFSDLKDGRQFTVPVPFNSFSDINISFTPAAVPPTGSVELGR
jgi:hypothetical protein